MFPALSFFRSVAASLCILLFAGRFAAGAEEAVRLEPGVPIYVSANEPGPVQLAAKDLARDCRNVLGMESPIVHERPALEEASFIEIVGPGATTDARGDAGGVLAGHEAHAVFALRDDRGDRVILQGADMRGTIYAIYTFSEQFLGVKPLWFWASQPPVPRQVVEVPPDADIRFDPPHVRWRAWFPNDTDLFTPWKKRTEENFEALYETMLRLKLNCFEGEVADGASFEPPYPLGRDVAMAQRRGLAFVGHHVHPLGCNYGRWDDFWRKVENREPPELSVRNVDALETFWRWHAELARRHGLEEIWLIGFRGAGDRPFWEDFSEAPSGEEERAAVIADMMKRQVDIVKEVTDEKEPVMRSTFYNELSDLYAKGLLRPPAEPNLIWTFVAARRDHYPAPDARDARVPPGQPVGYYFNFQFTSTGAHLAPAEGPWKMERNFRFIDGIASRPLEFSVVNMGNIREFVLEGAANAAMMWDFESYSSDRFLHEFCRTYFGEKHAGETSRLYADYFHSFWQQRRPTMNGFERQYIFQDLRLNRAMRELVNELRKQGTTSGGKLLADKGPAADESIFNIHPEDLGASDRLDAFLVGTREAADDFAKIVSRGESLARHLPAGDQAFFQDNLLVPARFLVATNETAHALASAVLEKNRGDRTEHLRAAGEGVAAMEAAFAPAKHGVFEDWYAGERIFGLKWHRDAIRELQD